MVGTLPEKLDVYFPERDPRECQGEDLVDGLEFYSLNTLLCARTPDIVELLLVF